MPAPTTTRSNSCRSMSPGMVNFIFASSRPATSLPPLPSRDWSDHHLGTCLPQLPQALLVNASVDDNEVEVPQWRQSVERDAADLAVVDQQDTSRRRAHHMACFSNATSGSGWNVTPSATAVVDRKSTSARSAATISSQAMPVNE